MGRCITVIKVIGATSLGLATGALNFSSFGVIPAITNSQYNANVTITELSQNIRKFILSTRVAVASLGCIATTAFLLAFDSSSTKGKHPYLIYAALGFPLSLISYAFQTYPTESKLLNISKKQVKSAKAKKSSSSAKVAAATNDKKAHLESTLDNSVYQDLGKTSSQEEDEEVEIANAGDDVDEEINNTIIKKESMMSLDTLKFGYQIISGFTGVAFAIAAVGLVGDKY